MRPLLVSYYTPNHGYPDHAARLRGDAAKVGLDCSIRCMVDTGSYLGNCRHKPLFVLDCFNQSDASILWVDVDASLLRYPDALDFTVDFQARRMPEYRDRTWHVGTLLFNQTEGARMLLESWVACLDDGQSDEYALEQAWRECSEVVTTAELPQSHYHLPSHGPVESDTVIAHTISRHPDKLAREAKPRMFRQQWPRT